ncbi:hypothetical protein NHX12_006736 [Muraenolepis orangiensis]|uniref:Radial spoke head 1 homolog n=1 Tax=Muraenolepis orangiensis TaxID=630683 RepID=A0A9Q0DQ94_9TELE|nr:hypothetical protein NHX12_006736 [Muraenolepis orangiensis]
MSEAGHLGGTYRFKKGARYIGNYDNNIKHGQGIFYYPDGSKYEGSWVDDQKQGQGVYTYPNGDTYDGGWLLNVRHGAGTYRYKDTGSLYRGSWAQGEQNGAGAMVHSNHRYEGTFINNQQHPEGDKGDPSSSSSAPKWVPRELSGPASGSTGPTPGEP